MPRVNDLVLLKNSLCDSNDNCRSKWHKLVQLYCIEFYAKDFIKNARRVLYKNFILQNQCFNLMNR